MRKGELCVNVYKAHGTVLKGASDIDHCTYRRTVT